MKKVSASVETKHKVTGRTLTATIEVSVYTDEELKNFMDLGMKEKHAQLLNKIIVIRAQDVKRRALNDEENKAVKKLFGDKMGLTEEVEEEAEEEFTIEK